MGRILGLCALLVIGTASMAFAVGPPVDAPELNGGTAVTALALLSGSLAVLRARLKR